MSLAKPGPDHVMTSSAARLGGIECMREWYGGTSCGKMATTRYFIFDTRCDWTNQSIYTWPYISRQVGVWKRSFHSGSTQGSCSRRTLQHTHSTCSAPSSIYCPLVMAPPLLRANIISPSCLRARPRGVHQPTRTVLEVEAVGAPRLKSTGHQEISHTTTADSRLRYHIFPKLWRTKLDDVVRHDDRV